MRLLHALAAGSTLLAACITCTQQVQQRESQAGQMRDVTDEDMEDSKEEKSTAIDLEAEIPLTK